MSFFVRHTLAAAAAIRALSPDAAKELDQRLAELAQAGAPRSRAGGNRVVNRIVLERAPYEVQCVTEPMRRLVTVVELTPARGE